MFRCVSYQLLSTATETDDHPSLPTLVLTATEGGTENEVLTLNVPDVGLGIYKYYIYLRQQRNYRITVSDLVGANMLDTIRQGWVPSEFAENRYSEWIYIVAAL